MSLALTWLPSPTTGSDPPWSSPLASAVVVCHAQLGSTPLQSRHCYGGACRGGAHAIFLKLYLHQPRSQHTASLCSITGARHATDCHRCDIFGHAGSELVLDFRTQGCSPAVIIFASISVLATDRRTSNAALRSFSSEVPASSNAVCGNGQLR